MTVIELYELPLDVPVQITQYRYLHSSMGDYFIITYVTDSVETYVRVSDGYVFKYLVGLTSMDSPPKFNLIRVSIPEIGYSEISINNDYVWKALV